MKGRYPDMFKTVNLTHITAYNDRTINSRVPDRTEEPSA